MSGNAQSGQVCVVELEEEEEDGEEEGEAEDK